MNMQLQEQESLEDFEAKIERAKKLFSLYNDITFGNKAEVAKSRIILKQIL
jgi:adenylate cyclase class IV